MRSLCSTDGGQKQKNGSFEQVRAPSPRYMACPIALSRKMGGRSCPAVKENRGSENALSRGRRPLIKRREPERGFDASSGSPKISIITIAAVTAVQIATEHGGSPWACGPVAIIAAMETMRVPLAGWAAHLRPLAKIGAFVV